MTRPAPSCFSEDNSRAEAMSGHQIHQVMTTGPGTASLQTASNTAAALERTYVDIENRLKRVAATLGESWVGASATAAIAAGNPINQATVQLQDALRLTDRSVSNQIYQFNHNKAQLKEMPAKAPETNFWDDATPWDTDTEDAVNGFKGDEAHNRRVYKEYQNASAANRGDLPTEMAGITADNLNVEIVDPGGTNVGNSTGTSGVKSPTGTGGWQNPGSPTIPGPQGQVTPPGTITGGDDTRTSWTGGGDTGGGLTKPGDVGNTVTKPPIGGPIERPANIGVPPFGLPPGTTGAGPGGGRGGGGSGSGSGAGRGPGAGGIGGAGKFGGAGTGTGTGATGTGSGNTPGGKTGVIGAGAGEHGPAARGGVAGAAGKAGAAGAGGMGAGAQRGQGDEDKEHKSADYLVNDENTNEIIGDMPMVAPPTIGE